MIYKKIAENNLEAYSEKTIKDINGVDHIVLEYKESYGQDKIDAERAKAEDELATAAVLNAQEYKANLIAKWQTQVFKFTEALKLIDKVEMIDKDGNTFEIYDEKMLRQYNMSTDLLTNAQEELTNAENLDENAYKQELVDTAQAKLDELDIIQAEMDREI